MLLWYGFFGHRVCQWYKISHFVWLILWSFIIYKLTGVIWRGKWVEAEESTSMYVPTGDIGTGWTAIAGKRCNTADEDVKCQNKE